MALHVSLVCELGGRNGVLHPLKQLIVGNEPDIGLRGKALDEAHDTSLCSSSIRQSRIVCQMGGVNIDTERLTVTVVVTIKVGLRPGGDISRSTSKVNIHELGNTSVV